MATEAHLSFSMFCCVQLSDLWIAVELPNAGLMQNYIFFINTGLR